MKNGKLTALDVQIISEGIMVQKYERLLVRGWISDWDRKMYQLALKSHRRKYLDLIHKWGYTEDYERYQEREYDRYREEKMEKELNDVWLEAYDVYQDNLVEEELDSN
jgi:hypothetical protein